jgi:subtilisin family serine protease
MRSRPHSLLRVAIVTVAAALALSRAPAFFSSPTTSTVIIEIKDRADIGALAAQYSLTVIDSVPELDSYLVTADTAILGKLLRDPNVQSVESNISAEISEKAILNESTVALLDPSTVALLDSQGGLWNSQNPSSSLILKQPAFQKIGLDPSVQPGSSVTVAVIDTGIDPFHTMLIGSVIPGYNFINGSLDTNELMDLDPATRSMLLQAGGRVGLNDTTVAVINPSTVALLDPSVISMMNSKPTPYFGHGTLVASLIHSIAPTAQIMPLKVFDPSGVGTSFRIAKAITYAATHGAQVINMSFSMQAGASLVDDALRYAASHNIVLIASIGNQDLKVDKNYPSSYNKVVGVAATDLQDQKADFSNYGPAANVAAPGVGLLSAYPAGLYAVWSGTSASAAMVSGEAAYILSKRNAKADDASSRICDRSDHVNDPPYQLGKGRISLRNVLK